MKRCLFILVPLLLLNISALADTIDLWNTNGTIMDNSVVRLCKGDTLFVNTNSSWQDFIYNKRWGRVEYVSVNSDTIPISEYNGYASLGNAVRPSVISQFGAVGFFTTPGCYWYSASKYYDSDYTTWIEAVFCIYPDCSCYHDLLPAHSIQLCQGDSVSLESNMSFFGTYHWSTGDTTPSITVVDTGTYYCIYTGVCDTLIDSVTVSFISLLPNGTLDSLTLCGNTNLSAQSGGTSYAWSNGASTQQISVQTAQTYYCTVSGNCNSVVDTFVVIDCPPTADFSASQNTVCENNCIQFSDLSSANAQSFHWSFSGGEPENFTGQNPPAVCYANAGTYSISLAVQNTFGADSITKTNYIQVFTAPSPNSVQTQFEIDYGESVTLTACATGETYHWIGTDCENCESVTVTPNQQLLNYSCIVSNNICSDTCVFTIKTNGIFGTIYVPNAFSPNGDNSNDLFQIFGNNIRLVRLQIFNRWGEKIFNTPDIGKGWDGRYKGVSQPAGVYTYALTYFSGIEDKARNLKGSITLIR